jgi:hypothetical protein
MNLRSVRLERERQSFKPWTGLTGWKRTTKKAKKRNMKSKKSIQEESNV